MVGGGMWESQRVTSYFWGHGATCSCLRYFRISSKSAVLSVMSVAPASRQDGRQDTPRASAPRASRLSAVMRSALNSSASAT